MPSHLRIFFWLTLAVAAYWVLSTIWFLEFPPGAVKALLANLPPATRRMIEQNEWRLELVPIAARAALFGGLAWVAAFKRQNWARLGVLVLFLIMHLVPLAFSVASGRAGAYLRSTYLDPATDLAMLILAAAIFFSFTGNARAAFASDAPE